MQSESVLSTLSIADRNFDFQPAYKEDPLIPGVRVCKGCRGRLCTLTPRPCFAMVSEMGACLSRKYGSLPEQKMYVDEGKTGAIFQLGRIVPVPIRVGDD